VENGTQKQPLHRDPEAWFPAVAPPPDEESETRRKSVKESWS
jgi:hypothetical protein